MSLEHTPLPSRTRVVDLGTMTRIELIEVAKKQASQIREKNVRINAMEELIEQLTASGAAAGHVRSSSSSNSSNSGRATATVAAHANATDSTTPLRTASATHAVTPSQPAAASASSPPSSLRSQSLMLHDVAHGDEGAHTHSTHTTDTQSSLPPDAAATRQMLAASAAGQDDVQLELVKHVSSLESALSACKTQLHDKTAQYNELHSKVEAWKARVMQTAAYDQQRIEQLQAMLTSAQRQQQQQQHDAELAELREALAAVQRERDEAVRAREQHGHDAQEQQQQHDAELAELREALATVQRERDEAVRAREQHGHDAQEQQQQQHDAELAELREALAAVQRERDEAVRAREQHGYDAQQKHDAELTVLRSKLEAWKAKVKVALTNADAERERLHTQLQDAHEQLQRARNTLQLREAAVAELQHASTQTHKAETRNVATDVQSTLSADDEAYAAARDAKQRYAASVEQLREQMHEQSALMQDIMQENERLKQRVAQLQRFRQTVMSHVP